MKTILHLIETGGTGGAETVLLNIVEGLDPEKWRSIPVVPGKGWLHDRLVECGAAPVIVTEKRSFDPVYVARLADIIRKSKVDLIHSHLFGSAVRAAMLSRLCGVPAIATLHGRMDVATDESFRRLKFRLVNSGLRRIVFVSEPLKREFLASQPIRPDRVAVIPNGVDSDRFSSDRGADFRSELGIGRNEFVIGAVGNQSRAKGFDILLHAVSLLRKQGVACRVVILGEQRRDRDTDVAALIRSEGLDNEVILAGFRDDVPSALAAFDVFVVSSRSEGFSLALIEAMAAGLPVIATRCGGPEQILEDGVTGILVENESPAALATAIRRLRCNESERDRFGAVARDVVAERFTLDAQLRSYESLYTACIDPTPSAAIASTKTVLVTDGGQRAALATVRSLGRGGFRVIVSASHLNPVAAASKYVADSFLVANSLLEPDKFFADIRRIVDTQRVDLLIPISEAALLALLPHRERLGAIIPFPDSTTFECVVDKRHVLAAAPQHGIDVPSQLEAESMAAAERAAPALRYPVVIKPARSVSRSRSRRSQLGVSYAESSTELSERLHAIPADGYPVLLQQRIDGPGMGISVLLWDGELRAAFAHQRIREKPPSGGESVLRESIPLDPELLSRSLDLLRSFGWQGVAMVEFKRDSRSQVPYLMEVNGRFWGSVQLAIDSGVNFPLLLVESALGVRREPVTTYKVGVRTRWEWGDVDNLVAMLFHSDAQLGLGHQRTSRLRSIGGFLTAFAGGTKAEVFRADDPRPFMRETARWIREVSR